MSATEKDDKPASTPLDAERAKLREAGYSDAEISQILIARAVGGQQHAGSAAGQGVLSNVVSSIVAIGAHARALVPSFRSDFATIFAGGAAPGARVGSLFSLLAKTAVIGVLAYAGWQEWQQHIVSATAISQAEAKKRHAEECSARMKMIVDTVPMNKWPEATADYERDCDPTYAARAQRCEGKYKEILSDVDRIGSSDEEFKAILKRLETYKEDCKLNAAQVEELKQKAVASMSRGPSPEDQRKAVEAILPVLDKLPMFSDLAVTVHSAMAKKDYPKAASLVRPVAIYYKALTELSEADKKDDSVLGLKAAEAMRDVVDQPGVINRDKIDEQREMALVSVAWFALMTKDFKKSLAASERAISATPDDLVPKTNKAHALLFLGRFDEAKAIYFQYRGRPLQGKTWELVIQDDFEKLRQAGVSSPSMKDIATMLRITYGAPPR